jgi:ParB family chromosome partitioning protein
VTGKAKGGLGRGLGALLAGAESPAQSRDQSRGEAGPTTTFTPADVDKNVNDINVIPTDVSELAGYREVDPKAITPNPRQPRTEFDPDALTELVASIREVGILQPPVVRERADGTLELIMGERRLRASLELGLDLIPVIVRATSDDAMLRDALLENLHRQQLNPLEEAAAYQQLMSDFGATHEQLAERIGRSRPQITNTIRLLNLPPAVQRRVASGVLTAGHARALLGLSDGVAQETLATRIVNEGLSVRNVEELVAMGKAAGATARKTTAKAAKPQDDTWAELAESIGDHLDTRVRIEQKKTAKGSITIEVADRDDLVRIARQILSQ